MSKAFLSDDGYLMHFIDGVWTDGDLIYEDLNGNPVGYLGQFPDGVHLNIVMRDEQKSGRCLDHGVSLEFLSADGNWRPMHIYGDRLYNVVGRAADCMMQQGREHQPERYRLRCCSCEGVVELPELEEA
jgi:hypothetical protein